MPLFTCCRTLSSPYLSVAAQSNEKQASELQQTWRASAPLINVWPPIAVSCFISSSIARTLAVSSVLKAVVGTIRSTEAPHPHSSMLWKTLFFILKNIFKRTLRSTLPPKLPQAAHCSRWSLNQTRRCVCSLKWFTDPEMKCLRQTCFSERTALTRHHYLCLCTGS